eukprot:XP_014769091.1 PREDICTED: uncharacterized protein LOC106868377 [Octopus bimaculoides]
MHCTMGKDEYDKSKGGILKASTLEQTDNQLPIGGKIDVAWDNYSPINSFKDSSKISLNNSIGQVAHEFHRNNSQSKEFASGSSRCKNKRIPSQNSVKSSLSAILLENNDDHHLDKSNGPLVTDSIDVSPLDNNSDNEDLGLTTHRPDINANQNIDLVRSSNFSNTITNLFNQSHRKKKDNTSKYHGEDMWRNNRKIVGKGKNDNFYNQSPSSVTSNSYIMHDQENLGYQQQQQQQQQHNYEQYVIPQNFAYTADDIYRKALSVGSYPNLMTPKKVPEMFNFVNALVSPPFFARSYHPEQRQQSHASSQFYSAIPPDGNGCLKIPQQSPGHGYHSNSIHQTQDYINSFYVDNSQHLDSRRHCTNVDYPDQHYQLHQNVNVPTNRCHDTWRNQTGEEFCNAIERNKCCTNSKPIFRSRSLSAVEQSNLCPDRGSPPHKSNYDFGKVENSFKNFHIGHVSSDSRHFNQQCTPQRNKFNSLLTPENTMMQTFMYVCPECHSENAMHAQYCTYCGESLTERAQPAVYPPDSMYTNFRDEEFSYPCDINNDDNVFNESLSHASSFPNSHLQSSSNYRITKATGRRQYQIQKETSHSFSPGEHRAFHSGASKSECYSDTEVTLKSPSTHKISSSCEWEDSSQDNLATPIFAMDEEMLNPADQNINSVSQLNLNDSILDCGSFSEADLELVTAQQHQLSEENSDKPSGKYTGIKGPRKVWRKPNATGSSSIDGSRLFTANSNGDNKVTSNSPVYHRHWEKSSCGSTSYLREPNFVSNLTSQKTRNKSSNSEKCKETENKLVPGGNISNFTRKDLRKVVQQNGTTKNRKKVHSKKATRVLSLMKGGNQDISLEAEKCLSGDVSIDVPYSEQILQESSTTSGFENSSSCVPDFTKSDSEANGFPESEKVQSRNSTSPWQHLPDEIWLQIFSNLSNHARFHCALVSKRFNRIIQDESLFIGM